MGVLFFGWVMSVDGFVREVVKPGVVWARVWPNGDYEVLRYVADVDAWLREDEMNRIAWDPAAYIDRIISEAFKEVDDALKAADVDIHPNFYDGGPDYLGGGYG
jgi:hypothetical protein